MLLQREQQSARPQTAADVLERPVESRRRVQDVRGDHHIEGAFGEALFHGIAFHIQTAELHEVVFAEAVRGTQRKCIRKIGERVMRAIPAAGAEGWPQ